MRGYLENLVNNNDIKILIIFIIFDVIFGVLRAIKERKINSTIGIDGIIRKCGMILSIILCIIVDNLIKLDMLSFIPEEIKNYIGMEKCGVTFIFNLLYVLFEILSIMKNMIKCKLPLPKKLKNFLEKLLKEFTSEIK